MRTNKNQLDVDFIGVQGALSVEEEKALSNFFQQKKNKAPLPTSKKINDDKQNSTTV